MKTYFVSIFKILQLIPKHVYTLPWTPTISISGTMNLAQTETSRLFVRLKTKVTLLFSYKDYIRNLLFITLVVIGTANDYPPYP